VASWASPAWLAGDEGGGLRTEFGEVRLQHLAIGKTYSVARLAAAPLVIRNASDDTLLIQLQVEIPAHHELQDGALPLPSQSWVQLEQADFELPAGATQRSDVHVSLPYDPDLAGKTYQVDFHSHMIDAAGNKRGARRIHRLLFTVEMDYRDDTEAQFTSLQPRSGRRER
jgi:hypothetical protein